MKRVALIWMVILLCATGAVAQQKSVKPKDESRTFEGFIRREAPGKSLKLVSGGLDGQPKFQARIVDADKRLERFVDLYVKLKGSVVACKEKVMCIRVTAFEPAVYDPLGKRK